MAARDRIADLAEVNTRWAIPMHCLVEVYANVTTKFASLFVIAPTATRRFDDRKRAVLEIAEQLGAGFVVEGSVQRRTDALRVSVQLITAETGGATWAHRYDVGVESLFDVAPADKRDA